MTSREDLIEEAATAGARAMRGATAHVGLRDREFAAAALAVFEEAHAPTCAPMCDRPCSPACVERHAPTNDEREALARIIDPEAWRDVQPHSTAFYDDEEAQKRYEGFFWDGVQERRAPSLAAADRVLGFRRTVQGAPTEAAVFAAAGAMPCVWSPAEPNHPRGRDCDRCMDRARAALRAAAEAEGGNR